MKKNYFSLLFCFTVLIFHAQTISFNTQTLGTGYLGNNGSPGISFVIVNTNPYPVYLKQIDNLLNTATTLTNVTLYHSTTSLSGAPGNITISPNWILDTTLPGVIISSGGFQNPILTNLNIAIPANDTFRFHLGATQSLPYTSAGATVTPNNFTNLGVQLLVGDFKIGGANVGYGGSVTASTINPRSFTGTLLIDVTPTTSCTGSPIAGSTASNDTNVCFGQIVNFSLAGLAGASGLSFQWQENGINLPNDTNSFLVKTITAANTYQCVVTCNNTSQSTTSNPLTMVLNPITACYCTSSSTDPADEDIGQVTLGAFVNGPGCLPSNSNPNANSTGYTDFKTSLAPIPVLKGVSTPISICIINSGLNYYTTSVKVFIDLNNDGQFKDSLNSVTPTGEIFLAQILPNFATNRVASANIIIPTTVPDGQIAMRIVANETSVLSLVLPCGTYTWGETEDYMLDIQTQVPCSGTPVVGTTAVNDTNVCFGQIVNFSLAGLASASGLSFQWQENGINLPNDTNSFLVKTIMAANTYQCVVTCSNTTTSSTSTPITMVINPFSVCYCPIVATSTTGADIGNVTVGTFTNGIASPIIGNATANKTYTDFTNLGPIQLILGVPNSISVSAITSATTPTAATVITTNVFVDFDQNGIFNPATELILSGSGNFVGANVASGSPIIPSSALTGVTRMRVMVYQSTAFDPCGPTSAITSGETEDYIVDIQPSPPCTGSPTAGSVASNDTTVCSSVSFNLSLIGNTFGSDIKYQWQANGVNL